MISPTQSPPDRTGGGLFLKAYALPLMGIIAAALQTILAGVNSLYWLTLVVLCSVSSITLAKCVSIPRSATIWEFFAGVLGAMYGFGALNTDLKFIQSPADLFLITAAAPIYVHRAMGNVLLAVSLLIVVGRFSNHRPFQDICDSPPSPKGAMLFAIGILVLCSALIAIGKIGYHGDIMTEEAGRPSSIALYALYCAPPAAALLAFVRPTLPPSQRWVAIVVIALLLLIQLYIGRRNALFTGMLCLAAHFAAFRHGRLPYFKIVLSLLVGVAIYPYATTAFMAMRLASYDTPEGEKVQVVPVISKAIDIAIHDKYGEVSRQSEENLRTRTYLIGYLAELTWRTEAQEPLYGDLLFYGVGMAIPRALWPTKFKYLRYGSEESAANPRLGLIPYDQANTIFTTGMTDFGLPGMLAYPMAIVALYSLVLRVFKRGPPLVYASIFLAMLSVLVSIENPLSFYFSSLREIVPLAVIGMLLTQAFKLLKGYNTASRIDLAHHEGPR